MKKIHFVPICILLLLLVSCTSSSVGSVSAGLQGEDSVVQSQVPEISKEVAYAYPEISDCVTWEKMNSFPVANDSMTEDELRSLCVDFFYYSKTAIWTPDRDVIYVKTADKDKDRVLRGGVYGGLPYIHLGTGNIYRLLECIDEETGVADMSLLEDEPKMFGNQCSVGAFWGWARVINSAQFRWSYDMVQSRGFFACGPLYIQ